MVVIRVVAHIFIDNRSNWTCGSFLMTHLSRFICKVRHFLEFEKVTYWKNNTNIFLIALVWNSQNAFNLFVVIIIVPFVEIQQQQKIMSEAVTIVNFIFTGSSQLPAHEPRFKLCNRKIEFKVSSFKIDILHRIWIPFSATKVNLFFSSCSFPQLPWHRPYILYFAN